MKFEGKRDINIIRDSESNAVCIQLLHFLAAAFYTLYLVLFIS